jgi:hypothetical protein
MESCQVAVVLDTFFCFLRQLSRVTTKPTDMQTRDVQKSLHAFVMFISFHFWNRRRPAVGSRKIALSAERVRPWVFSLSPQ